jgi:hemoglobin
VTDLVEQLGGRAVLDPVVAELYQRVLADDELAPIFEGVDVDELTRMQQQFLDAALRSGPDFSADAIRAVHAGHGITPRHFSRFVDHFLVALEERGVAQEVIAAIGHHLGMYADDVVGEATEVG